MSSSVPPGNPALDPTFLVGADLVYFDRRDLPIYQAVEEAALDTVIDETPYGTPLDRVFGEPGDVHLDGTAPPAALPDDDPSFPVDLPDEDPLVALGTLQDGLVTDHGQAAGLAGSAGLFDAPADGAALMTDHHAGVWPDGHAGADGIFDFQS
ncbi:hypothetical protein [Reyranella sp.]|uniref:hypothetical protein n=1 Tax=Reyranella sp. TaxID=1929291 RepID=UPI003BAADE91